MVCTVAQRRLYFVTDCVSGEGNAIGRVGPFVSILAFAPTDLRPCYFARLGHHHGSPRTESRCNRPRSRVEDKVAG